MGNTWILAQAADNDQPSVITSEPISEDQATTIVPDSNAPGPARPAQRQAFNPQSLIFLGLMFLVMYFLLFRGPRKKQKQHERMVKGLNKNDRIRTIGGILGTVVDIKNDEITLKVDESNNTKIKIAPSAIGKNLSEE